MTQNITNILSPKTGETNKTLTQTNTESGNEEVFAKLSVNTNTPPKNNSPQQTTANRINEKSPLVKMLTNPIINKPTTQEKQITTLEATQTNVGNTLNPQFEHKAPNNNNANTITNNGNKPTLNTSTENNSATITNNDSKPTLNTPTENNSATITNNGNKPTLNTSTENNATTVTNNGNKPTLNTPTENNSATITNNDSKPTLNTPTENKNIQNKSQGKPQQSKTELTTSNNNDVTEYQTPNKDIVIIANHESKLDKAEPSQEDNGIIHPMIANVTIPTTGNATNAQQTNRIGMPTNLQVNSKNGIINQAKVQPAETDVGLSGMIEPTSKEPEAMTEINTEELKTPKALLERMAQEIKKHTTPLNNITSVKFQLTPGQLGTVEVTVTEAQNNLSIDITATNERTLSLINDNINLLRQGLEFNQGKERDNDNRFNQSENIKKSDDSENQQPQEENESHNQASRLSVYA